MAVLLTLQTFLTRKDCKFQTYDTIKAPKQQFGAALPENIAVSNTGSNLRAGLTQPELFWSICLENSCCCVHTCYPSSSLCTIPRATVPPVTHWDGLCGFLCCLTWQQRHRLTAPSAPLPAQPNTQEAISGNTVSNLHPWDFLLSKFSAPCYPRTQKF